MKKYIVLTLVAAVMVLVQACGGSDDNPTPGSSTDTNLLKTWKVSQVLENSLDITAEFTQYRITFAESGTTKTYTLVDRQGTSSNGSWSQSTDGSTITLTAGGSSVTLTGVTITATQLKYSADEAGKAGAINLSFTLIPE
ncbi:MAG TPA: hypothetical protein DCS93_38460 [Microscillaceae bacterium]|nr:hypothetical protein [Microscillaceae bacterium]